MQGPMVVTQWINNHYYFSTVDNAVLAGSKITHNITGKFAVVREWRRHKNGASASVSNGDLEMYHQPLRLSVAIQAPLASERYLIKERTS
jgi:uncharacterized protein YbcC (UPF0753/DUF2309 family)